ncbi:hypothetical protein FD723_39955 (plasmid) [Nostoc sp. C052]|uniref:hypothetical protein n=1 Tax=Nostoc sp. C052 TaxID=2576902 RepID=UPI0015C40040|nr:hypothetical protein [Nostoc sp. C052]QLE46388.1 hypothetical protein FD723_39955 [Nostoc sp. C052]
MELILYIISGAAGSGKTVHAETLVGENNPLESDKFSGIYNDEGLYVVENQKASHDWNYEQFAIAIGEKKTPIAMSNTSMERRNYQRYIDLAIANGYVVKKINVEGTLFPDGSPSRSVHKVPQYIVDKTVCKYEPYVHQIRKPWHSNAPLKDTKGKRVLRLLDRDKTLVFNPDGGMVTLEKMMQIPGITKKVTQWKADGDLIATISNQAGIVAKHKTIDELFEEAKLLQSCFPIDLQLYCPNWEGDECLVYMEQSQKFRQLKRTADRQSFRKPQAGMIEYAMHDYFSYGYEEVEMIGNGREDYLAALAANIPYRHIHDVLYPS